MQFNFPTQSWAVFNGHVNDASDRAMAVCRLRFPADYPPLIALEAARRDGIMLIFQREPDPVTSLFADACFIFANGLETRLVPDGISTVADAPSVEQPKRESVVGNFGQDSQDRESVVGNFGQDSQDRESVVGNFGQDSQDRIQQFATLPDEVTPDAE